MEHAEKAIGKEGVNILILGETGVGKSTWINGIANYIKYNSLKDAMDAPEFTVLIPSRFIFTDDEGEEKEIAFGSDSNEELKDGQSATQFPREYTIETETTNYHLIDTPGIGDSRGIEKDKENFDNVLAFLTCYEKINAVVVLLKPNNARLTIAFKFCVLELLTHLHKSLEHNIIFAFTNSRGTFYRPGDTLPVLKKLLKEKNINITLSPETYFCFDNEAFRFLACQKKGVKFTDEDVELFSKSWDKSCDTTGRLFYYVKSMPPHETKKTLSLNEARSYIVAMSKPMGEAVQIIEMNLKMVNRIKEQCREDEDEIQKFQEKLHFKGFERKIKCLDFPITVCADGECKKYEHIGKSMEMETIYPQICHSRCYLKGVPVETTNNEQLSVCAAMYNGKCTECKHDYRFHMHMTYTTSLVEKEFLSVAMQKKITEKTTLKDQKEAFIAQLEERIKEYEEEKKYIFSCASHFGVFLKANAMIPYNDSFSDYLDMLIKDEEAKEKMVRDDRRIAQLKEDKRTYHEEKKIIMEKTSSPDSVGTVISIETIYTMKEELCGLKHNGRTLTEALDGIMYARKTAYQRESFSKKIHVKATSKNFLRNIGSTFSSFGSYFKRGFFSTK